MERSSIYLYRMHQHLSKVKLPAVMVAVAILYQNLLTNCFSIKVKVVIIILLKKLRKSRKNIPLNYSVIHSHLFPIVLVSQSMKSNSDDRHQLNDHDL